jgi:very-short-patch-repair endonuclease
MSSLAEFNLESLFADDRNVIPYRPELRTIAKSVTAAILLQQIVYWWTKSGKKPFYKFKQPNKSRLYEPGDSWCEELGFTGSEFDTALSQFAQKVSRKKPKDPASIVWYWINTSRQTFYEVNEQALISAFQSGEFPKQKTKRKPRFTNVYRLDPNELVRSIKRGRTRADKKPVFRPPVATKHEKKLIKQLKRVGLECESNPKICGYYPDILFREAMLIVEVDGKHHEFEDVAAYDKRREEHLKEKGYRIIRFTNKEIESQIVTVVSIIKQALESL